MRLPLALLAALVTCAAADTITINPSADTTLFERDPDYNWGAQSDLVAGALGPIVGSTTSRALLAFDIAGAIPPGSTITSAKITLRVVRTPGGGGTVSNFGLYRVGLPWTEGTKSGGIPGGATATAGETTWNSRSHPSTSWTSAGGKLEVDYAEDSSALASGVGGIGNYIFNMNSEGINDLQEMLDFPSSNHGWALISENESSSKTARRWGAREHSTNPPSLEITFTPPAPPAIFEISDASIDTAAGLLTLTFNALGGSDYEIEIRPELTSGNWTSVLETTASQTGPHTVSVSVSTSNRRLFFRVLAVN